ncbi:hypothetical protein, partial [Nocardioides sp.]|uniref:hypothetical protein n=1 Tax=Nocardioides sp. TaxID=35761 RepID=UPI0027326368
MEQPDQQQPDQPDRPPGKADLDRDPTPPPRDYIAPAQGRVLDPATALTVDGVTPRSTVYVGPRLTIAKSANVTELYDVLREVGRQLGWRVELDEEDPRTRSAKFGLRT